MVIHNHAVKKYIVLICVLFLPLTVKSQINLVLNPEFESFSACPDNIDEVTYCKYWNTLDSSWRAPDWAHELPGVPQYCHVCAPMGAVSIPIGGMHYDHFPRSKNGMMEVQMFYNGASTFPQARDYLQGHLTQNLIVGHIYQVSFYVISEQINGYAVNKIGAFLDNGAIDTTHNPGFVQTHCIPQIIDTTIINDTLNWHKIEDTFAADGTEKLITIGQFSDVSRTNYITLSSLGLAWYLVDDVSVIDCDNIPFAGNDTFIHPGDSAFIGPHENLLPYTWYKLGSGVPIDSGGGGWVHPTVTTTYVLKQILCGTVRYDTVIVNVWPVLVGNQQWSVGSLRVYPNPATIEITIENAPNCEVAFYDVTGREVLKSGPAFAKATTGERIAIDISKLEKGIYFVAVVDSVTGAKVVRKVIKE